MSIVSTNPNEGPTALTFDSLVTDLHSYLQRGGQSDEQVLRMVPRVVNRCERSVADSLKILGVQYALVSKLSVTDAVVKKPDGWRNTVSFNVGIGPEKNQRRTLRARSYEYIRSLYPSDAQLDAPRFYADYEQDYWLLGPAPDNDYPFEALVWRLPDLLSKANQANYLTKNTPNMLLYECLKALEPYVRNDPRMAIWKMLADDERKAITGQDMMRTVDRGQTRGPPA